MNFVIGSGPSGAACAMALLARGQPVTLIDGGGDLEPERRRAVDRLRGLDPALWRGGEVEFLRHAAVPDGKGIGTKHVYGSDYPYADVGRLTPIEGVGVDTGPSLAVGGFSNVWGATILPHRPEDIADWPVGAGDLAPHYAAVLGFMDASLEQDDLAELFPLHTDRLRPLRRSRQAEALLADLRRHRDRLREAGIWFGASRLAVRAEAREGAPGCAYCGLCMYGCPYGLIYTTATTLQAMEGRPGFRRISGVVVDRLRETGAGVEIAGRSRSDGSAVSFRAERVYLGAGALSSTRILLASLEAYDRPVLLRDSQYFLFPLVRYAGFGGLEAEPLHTLAQVFLEIRDPETSPHTVHLQIYTHNDLYAEALRKTWGRAAPLLAPLTRPLLARLLLAQGYLHSDHVPPIDVWLRRARGGAGVLHLEARTDGAAETDAMLRRVVRKVGRHASALRARPLGFMLHKTGPGRGYHSGGTFPMRRSPADFEADPLGRPAGFRRVHVVDSTVLPSIPATTITFSVMANAHRIGAQSLDG